MGFNSSMMSCGDKALKYRILNFLERAMDK